MSEMSSLSVPYPHMKQRKFTVFGRHKKTNTKLREALPAHYRRRAAANTRQSPPPYHASKAYIKARKNII